VGIYRSRHRDRLVAATVRVVAGGSSGTGFFVAPGLVVTCAHVIAPGAAAQVRYGAESYAATVLVREPAGAVAGNYAHPDVALLRIPRTDHPCVPLSSGPSPQAGRELFGYGCPRIGESVFWEHMPMASEGTRVSTAGDTWVKTSRAQVQPGASGAGVIDLATGELVGMLKLSRDPRADLGGVLVPTATILATLAAHDIGAANRAAVGGYDTVGEARRRLGRLLRALEADLSSGVGPQQLALMLYELGDEPPDAVDVVDAALALIHVQLGTLAAALTELARVCYSAQPPTRILGKAAALAVLGNNQAWVDPLAAELLAAERDRPAPRVVQVPGSRTRTVPLYATRATTRRNVTLVELAPGDASTDPVSGLPAQLCTAIRVELLRPSVFVPDPVPAAVSALWQANRAAALENARRLLFVLPEGCDDDALLAALQLEFPGCLFVLATRALRPDVRASGRVLELPGALPVEVERAAEERYEYLTRQLVEAAR
jgi:Trypsin-like peptidase domain